MIRPEQIAMFIMTSPFRPFALETLGGLQVVVETTDHIEVPPIGFDLIVVYGQDGFVHHIPVDAVVSASVYSSRWATSSRKECSIKRGLR